MKRKMMILTAMILAVCSCGKKQEKGEEVQREPSIYGFFTEDFQIDSSSVKEGETFSKLVNRLGMTNADGYRLTKLCDTVFDVRKLRAGNRFEAFYSTDSLHTLEYIVYHNNMVRSTVFHCNDSLFVKNVDKPTVQEKRFADVIIRESLWNDMIKAGASPLLIAELADIYQWSVNFFGLQEEDRFRIFFTQTLCEGEVFKVDTIHFCLFNSGKHEVAAMRYDIGKGTTYWGKDGASLKRMFLKAPLKYNRISSRFTYARKHPITGKVKPHTAVDYAAPKGTPVHAIGEGKVSACGWDPSGGGNRIRIKHPQGYESCYMHLSGFAKGIRTGSLVHQGDLIGYVGSTGHSTGPHLDFRIWKNGKPLDPLKLDSPSAEPLEKKYLEEFNRQYDCYMKQLDSLSTPVAERNGN
ncbi:MAG: peptidoglycan DD-metalloendopeptidase family protein [Bacteroidales bacterium]|nr:peptidoglycan DD-metalloendopeptidase family protein [Bacteroidales bacterium]